MTLLRGRLEVLEAALLLVVAHGLRRSLPMARWARLIGIPHPVDGPGPSGHPTPVDLRVRHALRRAESRLSRLPATLTCLDQAVAGSLMLQRRGARPSVVVGLDREDPLLGSHAWLVGASGWVLVGDEVRSGFTPVTAFRLERRA